MTDSVGAERQLVSQQTCKALDSAEADRQLSSQEQFNHDFPWAAKQPWKTLEMTRSAWYKNGRPTEKTTPAPKLTVLSDKHRRKFATRSKPVRSTTESA